MAMPPTTLGITRHSPAHATGLALSLTGEVLAAAAAADAPAVEAALRQRVNAVLAIRIVDAAGTAPDLPDAIAAHVPAAGVAEPSTLTLILAADGTMTGLLNSRINATPPDRIIRLREPILPGYTSYRTVALPGDDPRPLADIIAALRDAGIPCRRFVVTGDAARFDLAAARWQRLADALRERLKLRPVARPTDRGAAILAAITAGRAATGHPVNSTLIKAMAQYAEERLIRPQRRPRHHTNA